MSGTDRLATARNIRNDALAKATHDRALATHDADVEYSETVAKLRERYDHDLAAALQRHLSAVRGAHRAFNAATIRAEDDYARETRLVPVG